jgi:hypothetical protein
MEPTNKNIEELFSRFQSQAQSTSPEMAKFVLSSPYKPDQKARYYLNTQTGECFYAHQGGKTKADGKFWGYRMYTPEEVLQLRIQAIQEGTWKLPFYYKD